MKSLSNPLRLACAVFGATLLVGGCQPSSETPVTDPAVAARQRVLLQPNTVDAWIALGQTYLDQEKYNDAFIAFKRAWGLNQQRPEALRGLAEASLALNNPQAGMVWAQRALSLDPRDGAALGLRGRLKYAEGDLAGAYTDLQAARRLGPLSLKDSLGLTSVYWNQKKTDQAVAEADATVRRFPLEAQAHHNYAILLDRLDRGNDAEDQYRLAVKCDPKLERDKLLLAELLLKENRKLDEARSLALEVATKAPVDGTAAAVAARALWVQGRKEESLQELLRVQQDYHSNVLVVYWILDEARGTGNKEIANAAAAMLDRMTGRQPAAAPRNK